MVLSTEARGMVERYTDAMLATIPLLVQYFSLKANQQHLQYKEPDDVVFGYVWGAISARHSSYIITLQSSTKYSCGRYF